MTSFEKMEKMEKYEETPETVEEIESENAKYRLVKSWHFYPNEVRELGNPDAVILETGTACHYPDSPKKAIKEQEQSIQYKNIINESKERETPIYFVDTPFKKGSIGEKLASERREEKSKQLSEFKEYKKKPFLEHSTKKMLITAGLLVHLAKSLEKKTDKPISRREFLKSMTKASATLLLASPLANPAYDLLEKFLSPKTKIKKEYKEIMRELILSFRNAAMAEKIEHVAKVLKDNNEGKKPNITIFAGAGHFDKKDETSLKNLLTLEGEQKSDRIKIINKFLQKPSFSEHIINPRDINHISCLRYSKKDNDWELESDYDDYMLGGGRTT